MVSSPIGRELKHNPTSGCRTSFTDGGAGEPKFHISRLRQGTSSTHVLGCVYGAQELHELVTDLGGGFVLYPVAHIVEFETPHETGKAGAQLFEGWIERPQAVRFSPNVKGRLGDLRAFPSGRHIEIRFGGAVVVQPAV